MTTEQEKKPKYIVPTVEDLEESRERLMPLLDKMTREGKIR